MNTSNKKSKDTIESIFFESGESYEVTLNPAKQYINDPKRLVKCTAEINSLLLTLSDVADVQLMPELSEPRHSNPDMKVYSRMHYHGTLTLASDNTSAGRFLLIYLSKIKQYGDYQFNKTVGDGNGFLNRKEYWTAYCIKQQSVMEPLYRRYKLPYIHQSLKDPSMLRLAKLEAEHKSTPRDWG